MTVIAMSRPEIDRMHVLRDLEAGRMTVNEAAQRTRLTRRHVFRLAKAYRERGPSALVSTRRGQPSNHRYPAALRTEALGLIKANYADFGPTLACEKLAERHGLHLGVETVRQWMLADGLWRDRRAAAQARAPAALSPGLRRRARADRRLRAWVVRGPRPAVHALGVRRRRDEPSYAPALLHLRFVPTESTFDYFEATRAYLQRHGKPVAFDSDKHSVFRVNRKDAAGGDGMTHFGRALDQLNIDIICANAPQAKGRVERA